MVLKTIVGLTAAILLASAWYVSPIMKPFPKPTGPYQVGLRTLEFVNTNRSGPEETRTLVVHAWYPADAAGSAVEKAPYLGDKMSYFQKMMAQYLHVPEWVAQVLFRGIKTHAVDSPVQSPAQRYPVVLFSHGLLGVPSDMYTVILEDIASHGYIVLAIDHPGFNELTLYRDGRVVSSHDMSVKFQKMSPQEQRDFQSKAIEIYKNDLNYILDMLATYNNQEVKGILFDLNRIAVMGHSAGGTAAIEFCRNDARCKAAIDLDGWYDQVIGEKAIGKPLLLMFGSKSMQVSEPTPDYLKRKELTRDQYFERERTIAAHRKALCADAQCQMIVIKDAEHGDFGDGVLLKWPLRAWNAVDAYTTIRSINAGVIEFLDKYVK